MPNNQSIVFVTCILSYLVLICGYKRKLHVWFYHWLATKHMLQK